MSDYFEIDFFHVDAKTSGDAICIRYELGGATCIHIVDGGYVQTGEAFEAHIREFYDNPAFIDHVVATHPDGDHAGGLRRILENFEVGTLWMLRPWIYADQLIEAFPTYSSVDRLRARLRSIYPNIATLEDIALARDISISEPFQGQPIGAFTVLAPSPQRWGQLILNSEKTPESDQAAQEDPSILGAALRELHRAVTYVAGEWGAEVFSPEETSSENEMSVVQYANLCDRRILLTADAGRGALTEAADFAPSIGLALPGIDRFQVPHHGSRRNLSTDILDRWLGERLDRNLIDPENPEFDAVVSASREDDAHPRKVVVRSLLHRGSRLVSTDDGRGTKRIYQNAPDREGWTAATPLEYPEDTEEE